MTENCRVKMATIWAGTLPPNRGTAISFPFSLTTVGSIRCRVPRLPLPAGHYVLNLMGASGGTPADWVQRACELTVAEGDFFGSGRRLPDSHQTVLVEQEWGLAGEPLPIDTQATA